MATRAIYLSVLAVCVIFGAKPSLSAPMLDKFMQIQPIQVCDDNGANCASAPLSKAFTQSVYEQAGVAAIYLPTKQIRDTSLLNVDGVNDVNKPGNGQSTNALTLNSWFVNSLNAPPNSTLFGEGYVGGNGTVINSSAVEAASRSDTVAHEVGHNLGLEHNTLGAGGADNLMTRGNDRNAPASGLTQDQIDEIRGSQFVQSVPKVTVDLRGSTPFQSTNFFDISFDDGPDGVSLTELTLDMSPVNAFFDPTNAPPGYSGSSFGFGSLSGVSAGDVTVNGITDGSQKASLSFDEGSFTAGDSIAFGSDVDLFSAIDSFGATPSELVGMEFTFEFNIGLSLSTILDSDLVTNSLSISQINDVFGAVTAFGPQVPQGQIPQTGPIDIEDPIAISAVPAPGTIWLFLSGLVVFGWFRRLSAPASLG